MKIRLYLDEDSMSRALLQGLRARNIDVVSALDDGMIERNDKEHLEHATDTGRVLYSYNVGDFCRLHADFLSEGREHAGNELRHVQSKERKIPQWPPLPKGAGRRTGGFLPLVGIFIRGAKLAKMTGNARHPEGT